MAKVFIFDQPDTLYEQCAQRFLQLAREVLEKQERFHNAAALKTAATKVDFFTMVRGDD